MSNALRPHKIIIQTKKTRQNYWREKDSI